MGLLPPYYTTTNLSRKRKKLKKTTAQLRAETKHAEFLKRLRNKHPSPQNEGEVAKTVSKANPEASPQTKEHEFYDPSMAKKESKVYTGTEIIGIATMHKSNAIPVRGKKQAEEISKMRRN
tara:strand:- start:3026 stop:3388 length:363 start_codon:yes stop_codon:yes gene_type:complete